MIDGSDPFSWDGGISKFPAMTSFNYLSFGDIGGPTDDPIKTETDQHTPAASQGVYISFSENPLGKNLKAFRNTRFIDYEYRKASGSDIGRGTVKFISHSLLGGLIKIPPKHTCLLYTSPSPRDRQKSRMPSSA